MFSYLSLISQHANRAKTRRNVVQIQENFFNIRNRAYKDWNSYTICIGILFFISISWCAKGCQMTSLIFMHYIFSIHLLHIIISSFDRCSGYMFGKLKYNVYRVTTFKYIISNLYIKLYIYRLIYTICDVGDFKYAAIAKSEK